MKKSKRGKEVVRCLKTMFSRHGILEKVDLTMVLFLILLNMLNLQMIGDS